MLSVIYAECCYAECRYAECRGALETYLPKAGSAGTVVEHSLHNPKVKGSSSVTGEKMSLFRTLKDLLSSRMLKERGKRHIKSIAYSA
jgi:hypothetical protein